MGKSGRLSVLAVLILGVAACGGQGGLTAATSAADSDTTAATTSTAESTTNAGSEPSQLSVLEWAFYEVPEMWVEFGAAHPETEVVFNFGASDADIYAKILAGSGEDIMHFYRPARTACRPDR